jgi:predicted RNA-binding Zn-ribbon protein involved in translation (DUF1610 family)
MEKNMTIKEKNILEYNKDPKKCEYCNNNLQYDKRIRKFCDSSCAAKFNNKLRKKYNNCLYCNNEINIKKKYCDNKCQQDYQYNKRLEKCNGNLENLGHSSIRKFITEKEGYKCSECGISEWNNKKIVLELEHKDGNSENNKEENLCFLCPNCHSQTDTFKGKNKGNGRFYRRQRYKEGKSY